MIDTLLLLLAFLAAGILLFLGVLLGLFGLWCILSKKTLDELRDEGFYD